MSTDTSIEWATKTWGPVLGCKRVSRGCDGCYAIRTVHRLAHNPSEKVGPLYVGLTERTEAGRLDWTGVVRTIPGRLGDPLGWRKPERIFVNSQSDLFHPAVSADFIAHVWATMAATPRHTYQILTKRPDIAAKVLGAPGFREAVVEHLLTDPLYVRPGMPPWPVPKGGLALPLPNVWLGTSVEDQATAEERIPKLLRVPAAIHWISAEPLLGPVDLRNLRASNGALIDSLAGDVKSSDGREIYAAAPSSLDWVVVGGESGPEARPMHPAWAQSLRDQCAAGRTPFLFKQWGQHVTEDQAPEEILLPSVSHLLHGDDGPSYWRVSKKAAGRLLDGIEHNGYPREQVAA